jgi:cytochrome c oxidase subunit 3
MYQGLGLGNRRDGFKSELQVFHLVNPSPWPIAIALVAGNMALGLVAWFQNYWWLLYPCRGAIIHLLVGCLIGTFFIAQWFYDTIAEAAYEGKHSKKVLQNLKWGMLLFIVSEGMLFFSFFAALFYYGTNPSA